jgi:hypothetical protein
MAEDAGRFADRVHAQPNGRDRGCVGAHKRGVDVRLLVDRHETLGGFTAANFVSNHGIELRAESRYAIMHDKFIATNASGLQIRHF